MLLRSRSCHTETLPLPTVPRRCPCSTVLLSRDLRVAVSALWLSRHPSRASSISTCHRLHSAAPTARPHQQWRAPWLIATQRSMDCMILGPSRQVNRPCSRKLKSTATASGSSLPTSQCGSRLLDITTHSRLQLGSRRTLSD